MTISHSAADWLPILHSKLSRKAYRQFEAAIGKTTCAMLTDFILPMAHKECSALSIVHTKKWPRDHKVADGWSEAYHAGIGDEVPFHTEQFFTNALRFVREDHPLYNQPKDRVALAGMVCFTFEFDQKDMGFFEQQCGWMRAKGKGKVGDSKMGELFLDLSNFADFCGINVTWSGNKSFHIHCVFDASLLMRMSAAVLLLPDPRDGLIAHWQRLKKTVLAILQPTLNGQLVEPDKAMENPDSFRRLPLGTRTEAGSFFGMADDAQVPQLVMWEQWRPRAAPGATALFFSESDFQIVRAQVKAQANRTRSVTVARNLPTTYTTEQIQFFEIMMREHFPDDAWPRFAHFAHDARGWSALFYNHAADSKPASIMREGFHTVKIEGSDPHGLAGGAHRLPLPLGEAIQRWAKRFDEEVNPAYDPMLDGLFDDPDMPEVVTETVLLEKGHVVGASDIEQRFAERAATGSRADIAAATKTAIIAAMRLSRCIGIKGAEGLGKTTVVSHMIPNVLTRRKKMGLAHHALFAFTGYPGAVEKCQAFNAWARDRGFHHTGVVLHSFSRLYDMARESLGLAEKISMIEAGKQNCTSQWKAIEKFQPEVIDWIENHCADVHRANPHPIFFSVHKVAEDWGKLTPTRLIWSPSFWRDYRAGVKVFDRNRKAAEETRLAYLVHDEISAAQIVAVEPAEVVEWVRAMAYEEPRIWKTNHTSLADTWDSFDRYAGAHLPPVDRSTGEALTFEKARELFHLGVEQWQDLTLTADGAYPEGNPNKPLYTRCVAEGHRWLAKPTMWWADADVADHIFVLTTEMLPTACLERADPDGWLILSLETAMRDTVDVYFGQQVTSAGMAATCADFAARICPAKPDSVLVISDSVKGRVENSDTHVAARGSNEYVGRHVLQTMSFMNPAQHEELLALNAYTGRDDCVGLYHLDRFNQSAGRNVGFRKSGEASHTLVINPRLNDYLLESTAWYFSRYDLVIHVDARQRKHLTTKRVA